MPRLVAFFMMLVACAAAVPALGQTEDAPHLLACTVKDTLRLTSDGVFMRDPAPVPGTRALGRIDTFVIDPPTGVVRLPGLSSIAWIVVKGATPDDVIYTPVTDLTSATSVSIHLHRSQSGGWFIFEEPDRVMAGTCALLP